MDHPGVGIKFLPWVPITPLQQTVIPLFGSTGSDENVECDEIIGWELTLRKVEGDKNERQYAIQVEVLDPATTTQ